MYLYSYIVCLVPIRKIARGLQSITPNLHNVFGLATLRVIVFICIQMPLYDPMYISIKMQVKMCDFTVILIISIYLSII